MTTLAGAAPLANRRTPRLKEIYLAFRTRKRCAIPRYGASLQGMARTRDADGEDRDSREALILNATEELLLVASDGAVSKAGLRLGADLASTSVTALSIWMGGLLTDRMKAMIEAESDKCGRLEAMLETPEFTGYVVWELFQDMGRAKYQRRTVIGAELARDYGLVDAGGRQPPSCRETYKAWALEQFDRIIR